MAVKASYGPTSVLNNTSSFGAVPESPSWPKSTMIQNKAASVQGNIYSPGRSSSFLSASSQVDDSAEAPFDITAPSPSTSESSTIFTDLDADEEPPSAATEDDAAQKAQNEQALGAAILRSPSTNLKINTTPLNPPRLEEEDQPQSVIHIPSGFGRFVPPGSVHRNASRLSQSHLAHRPHRSLSQSSSTVSAPSVPKAIAAPAAPPQQQSVAPPLPSPAASLSSAPVQPPERPGTASSDTTGGEPKSAVSAAPSLAQSLALSIAPSATESTAPSESTLRAEIEVPKNEVESYHQQHAQQPLSPMSTNDLESLKDWASTPRAQTRQDLFSLSRPGSSLASIREGDDDEYSDYRENDALTEGREAAPWNLPVHIKSEGDTEALELALSECWTLCNTLASLSHLHRERIFTNHSGKDDKQEQAWKACWKLCQTLYETKDDNGIGAIKSILSLCRDLCQSLFEVRVRTNEAADSVLRVSFELNNHLFNTHDRSLPEAFRERTLEFYVTLCHRLMKQKSKMGAETDSLLRACWTLAEMLFSLRQNKRENRKPDQDLLCQAMQACWDLCDLFRAGWTQVRPDRGTPRASQTTFSQAFQSARKAGHIEDPNTFKITPETPTTIFDDTATVSPDDAAVPTISIIGHGHPTSAKSAPSGASVAALPRPNTTQRMSRTSSYNKNRWGSINEALSEDENGQPASAVSQSSRASSHLSLASSRASSQHTARTPSEDPSLTMMKALFVRAAVATGRGFSPDPRNAKRDPTYTSLPLFVRSLPESAFGPQKWQRELLEHYKTTVAQDSTFKSLGNTASAFGLGIDPEKGREDIANILKGLVDSTPGWGWLRDLFRYGYGTGLEDVLSKAKSTRDTVGSPPPPRLKERTLTNGSLRSNTNGNGNGGHTIAGFGISVNGNGNEGRKVSPPRR